MKCFSSFSSHQSYCHKLLATSRRPLTTRSWTPHYKRGSASRQSISGLEGASGKKSQIEDLALESVKFGNILMFRASCTQELGAWPAGAFAGGSGSALPGTFLK
jgi:hypothetical protein